MWLLENYFDLPEANRIITEIEAAHESVTVTDGERFWLLADLARLGFVRLRLVHAGHWLKSVATDTMKEEGSLRVQDFLYGEYKYHQQKRTADDE